MTGPAGRAERLAEAFAIQSRACAKLGSPFMARLCGLLADRDLPDTPLKQRLWDWPGDLSPRAASIPLRLCGGLHALALQGHPGLQAVYPPQEVPDDQLWQAVAAVFVTEAAFLDAWMNSAPQTNEVRRAAVMIAAGHLLQARFGLPLRISELGASAGLNLMWDRFALDIGGTRFGPAEAALTLAPDWDGPLPPPGAPRVAARRGVDLNPLDPSADGLRLRAFLWPDQPHRTALTEAAIAVAAAPVDRADAIDWLADKLDPCPGQCHLIYHTVAWQYFPPDTQARGEALIAAAGAAAQDDAPLAWLGMEADGNPDGAGLTLRLWPGDIRLDLGRADFHGRWLRWTGGVPASATGQTP